MPVFVLCFIKAYNSKALYIAVSHGCKLHCRFYWGKSGEVSSSRTQWQSDRGGVPETHWILDEPPPFDLPPHLDLRGRCKSANPK